MPSPFLQPHAFDKFSNDYLQVPGGSGLEFKIKDLAGQAVYGISNQFFLVERALFVLVWRIVPNLKKQATFLEDVQQMVIPWLDTLELRVPGASVVIVATHIDCADVDTVDWQCKLVETAVAERCKQLEEDAKVTGINSLKLYSVEKCPSVLRLNCLDGTGIEKLKSNLIEMAQALPWWREKIPHSYLSLQDKIQEMSGQRSWLPWTEYANVAQEYLKEDAAIVKTLSYEKHLEMATRFLHDNATLKFFGKYPMDAVEEQQVEDVVYINPKWIIDTLKGLIRHSRDSLLEFFASSEHLLDSATRTVWRRRIHRLATYGILHMQLVPFLWPDGSPDGDSPDGDSPVGDSPVGDSLSKTYWRWARSRDEVQWIHIHLLIVNVSVCVAAPIVLVKKETNFTSSIGAALASICCIDSRRLCAGYFPTVGDDLK